MLVAYFSCTNTTKGVAEKIAVSTGGTLYSITPAEPYTSANLNYSDRNSRSTKEQNDSSARPEISGSVENMDEYDIIFFGYPIWWAEAPKIIYTFLERELFLTTHFKFLQYGEPVIKFLFDYVCAICLFGALGYYSNKGLLALSKKKKGALCNTEKV